MAKKSSDSMKLVKVKRAAAALVDAIMTDTGGFSRETLHAMVALEEAVGLPDYGPVTAATDWQMSGEGEENVRFWGQAALADARNN